MYTHSIMKELQDRREKERHLAINTVVTIRVSKPFAANLQMKSMILAMTLTGLRLQIYSLHWCSRTFRASRLRS